MKTSIKWIIESSTKDGVPTYVTTDSQVTFNLADAFLFNSRQEARSNKLKSERVKRLIISEEEKHGKNTYSFYGEYKVV